MKNTGSQIVGAPLFILSDIFNFMALYINIVDVSAKLAKWIPTYHLLKVCKKWSAKWLPADHTLDVAVIVMGGYSQPTSCVLCMAMITHQQWTPITLGVLYTINPLSLQLLMQPAQGIHETIILQGLLDVELFHGAGHGAWPIINSPYFVGFIWNSKTEHSSLDFYMLDAFLLGKSKCCLD